MNIYNVFRQRFDTEPEGVFRSPGRINLIGEHTDYNEGFVLPAAIDRFATVAAARRSDSRVALYAVQFGEGYEEELAAIHPIPGSWTDYILGVADELVRRGYRIGGFNMVISGDVPVGAGLSSSAAIECAVGFALSELFGLGLSRLDLARIGQAAEHRFPGVQCGIMDQFASVFGKKDHALKLDCRSLEYEEVPLRLGGYTIVLLNTNVKHSLASSAYNERRQQCADGVAAVARHHNGVTSLRDTTLEMLASHIKDPLIYKRCRYVVEENMRVASAVEQMRRGSISALGELMYESHRGLSDQYEVSCPELDYLVEAVKGHPAVAGGRMMGGGFGGCTINLIREDALGELIDGLEASYRRDMGKPLSVYIATTADGTSRMAETIIV